MHTLGYVLLEMSMVQNYLHSLHYCFPFSFFLFFFFSLSPSLVPCFHAAAAAKSLQSCLTLCDPIDSSRPGSPVPWILQARTQEWVNHFLLQCMKVKSESEVAQSCPTLSDPMDCSLPGSSVHGIFQARVLEWGAIAFSVSNTRGQ